MVEKRFLLEQSDYDLKYEFRVADLSRVEKTKEDFWNEEEEIYNYRGIGGYLDYLYKNNAFLTEEEADKILNELNDENKQLKEAVWSWSHSYKRVYEQKEQLKQRIKELEVENEEFNEELMECDSFKRLYEEKIERLEKENKQLKEGMIGVVDRYIRNVEHNPPSSVKTYLKVKGALVNVREGLRDLLEDLE